MNKSKESLHFNNLICLLKEKHGRLALALLLVLASSSLACSLSSRMVQEAGGILAETPVFQLTPLAQIDPPLVDLVGAAVESSPEPESTTSATSPGPPSEEMEEQEPSQVVPENPEPLPTELPEPAAPAAPAVFEPAAPTSAPLSDPYHDLRIESLVERSYGEGELVIHQLLAENSAFSRYLISYPSDGLVIYGFMNVPKRTAGPYPVVIALHGYIDPAVYRTLDYTTGYADTLARAGFLVLHPNLRNYPPSDQGDNLFRVGMAIDVLNLIALVKQHGSTTGHLEQAKPDAIGIWGHSMGGGISLRVITVSPDVRAAVLYGSMSGDEQQNYTAISRWSNGQRGQAELEVPATELSSISPVFYLNRIEAKVSVHHGESDQLVPLQWSLDLCKLLEEHGKPHSCYTYPGQLHTFDEAGSQLFMQRVIDFFTAELK